MQFVEACRTSGMLGADELRRLTEAGAAEDGATLSEQTARLVAEGKLTRYQVAELTAGRGPWLVRGDYTILEPLGSGGMGRVFKAVHRRMDRVVAIKELPTEAVDSPAARDRFHQEVKAAARLIHPHIVTAFDAGEQEGVPYLVMEYVDGQDLATVLKESGELPLPEALSCILQVARGLDYAHSRGIVHRDIKPGNLLLDWAGTIRILDMGLARLDAHAGAEGEIVGTFDYMAPEQAAGQAVVDGRADIYSLGCTLYRIVTGRSLYAGATPEEKRRAHREASIPRLGDCAAEIPESVEMLFLRMVAKNPRQRPATMGQMILEIEECLAEIRKTPALVGAGAGGGPGVMETSSSSLPPAVGPTDHVSPLDTAHESTVITRAGEELTHPATAPAIPVPVAAIVAPTAEPAVEAVAETPVASDMLAEATETMPAATPAPEPVPATIERAPAVADLAWPVIGIIAAGIAAVAIGAGIVIWLNS